MNEPGALASLSRREMEAILAVTRALAASFDLPTMLAEVAAAARRVLHAERISVWLHDARTDELVIEVANDRGHIRVPVGTGLAGFCAKALVPINVPDCYADVLTTYGRQPQLAETRAILRGDSALETGEVANTCRSRDGVPSALSKWSRKRRQTAIEGPLTPPATSHSRPFSDTRIAELDARKRSLYERANQATPAGREPRRAIPRTTGPGLVACRWCSG